MQQTIIQYRVGDATDLDSLITNSLASAAGKTTLIAGPGAQNVGVTLTDAQINGSLTRLWTQYRGVNNSSGLVSVARAADIEADDSGQYGINLSGYIDDLGSGVEWGLYFNNSLKCTKSSILNNCRWICFNTLFNVCHSRWS